MVAKFIPINFFNHFILTKIREFNFKFILLIQKWTKLNSKMEKTKKKKKNGQKIALRAWT